MDLNIKQKNKKKRKDYHVERYNRKVLWQFFLFFVFIIIGGTTLLVLLYMINYYKK